MPVAIHCMPTSPPQVVADTQQFMLREVAVTRRGASMPSYFKMPPPIPSAQGPLILKGSAGMRQSVITKAPPTIAEGTYLQCAKNAFGTGTVKLRDHMTQHGWAVQCAQLLKGLKDEGRPNYLRPDADLLKEYEDWREYVSHMEHLYALCTNGRTGLAFRKACDRWV